ncbi:regulatory iron-sulfur-containing complex subunit RicT [uncultured Sanguibacteroides sp.]|uniref:PSP1 domain-containing protein n=1 Tax=uncultured Sanguibacteroides sp. TaxID=1635151 RepID=UPI0025FFD427|nr:regulatory iron-sulfur-containing complex subunit RicT [uncultured Sanguibacteroides sp.]
MSEEINEEIRENPESQNKQPYPIVPVIDHRLLAGKLTEYNWMQDIPEGCSTSEIVEVRFKNTRKGFYLNNSNLNLNIGDIVAVEAALGHDIGIVSLTGELVREQMRLKRVDLERNPLKKVYRKAKPHDIEKWQQAIALEYDTMIKSRKIAADLNLDMKIGDVEYQGDKTKAIFYYIAGDRVDFRKLIKVLAETFHIRIEMKQIGARQEAGRIGGIGSCGRKLCCSTFITNFISVSTSAARYQDISLNPQKLAGQCGKLKCCLNYEVDAYIDEQKDFPSSNIWLNTGEGMLYHQKTDIFGRSMSYTYDKEGKGALIKLPVERVKEIIAMNKRGYIPPKALDTNEKRPEDIKYTDGVGEESLNRFDEKKQPRKNYSKNRNNRKNVQKNNNRTEANNSNGNKPVNKVENRQHKPVNKQNTKPNKNE